MKPELRDNLEDALKHGREILNFVSGMSLEQYSEDEKTRLAVERLFEIIGEALNRSYKLDPELVDSIPNYRQIIPSETFWLTAMTPWRTGSCGELLRNRCLTF